MNTFSVPTGSVSSWELFRGSAQLQLAATRIRILFIHTHLGSDYIHNLLQSQASWPGMPVFPTKPQPQKSSLNNLHKMQLHSPTIFPSFACNMDALISATAMGSDSPSLKGLISLSGASNVFLKLVSAPSSAPAPISCQGPTGWMCTSGTLPLFSIQDQQCSSQDVVAHFTQASAVASGSCLCSGMFSCLRQSLISPLHVFIPAKRKCLYILLIRGMISWIICP